MNYIIYRNFSFLPKQIVIVAAKRTPFGSFMGSLSSTTAPTLSAATIKSCLTQSTLQASDIQQCILGNVYPSAVGQSPSRQAALLGGLSESTICMSINKACSSGLKSITLAAEQISLGISNIIIAGGMQNMSLSPFLLPNYRTGHLMGDLTLADSLLKDGLECPFNKIPMGGCTQQTVKKYEITREQQDRYCIQSYKKSTQAYKRGFFSQQVINLDIKTKKEVKTINQDQEYKKVKIEKIPNLKPTFKEGGTITAANASTINDGACSLILMSAQVANQKEIKPLAKILSFADYELEPVHFGIAPSGAIPIALKRAGVKQEEVDLFEINQAFSSVVLANMKILSLDEKKVNVNGGAVSLGHPVGASGARILTTLIYGLKERKESLGVAGICNGGGGATAVVIQNID